MIDLEKLRDQAEDDLKRGREWSTTSRDVLMLLDHIAKLEEKLKNKEAVRAQRPPLSATEVSGLLESAGYWPRDSSCADFINGIRYAEMEHGITQEKQG